MTTEADIIAMITRLAAKAGRAIDVSDDVAVLRAVPQDPLKPSPVATQIITVDALVEGVHILPDDPADTIARKLVRVNVSDILAKGALPNQAVLTLGLSKRWQQTDAEAFVQALGHELAAWDIALLGGDTVGSPNGVFVSLTLVGTCLAEGPVRRDGGRAGDRLLVTGEIGAGLLGLEDARSGKADSAHVVHYQCPELPDAEIARIIADHATAAMDVSDGLLGDALAMATASGCGADIDLSSIPYAARADTVEDKLRLVTGGDDYQCLLAIPPDRVDAVRRAASEAQIRITRVGNLQSEAGLTLTDGGVAVPLPSRLSYSH